MNRLLDIPWLPVAITVWLGFAALHYVMGRAQ
jgi:hypothetical protein